MKQFGWIVGATLAVGFLGALWWFNTEHVDPLSRAIQEQMDAREFANADQYWNTLIDVADRLPKTRDDLEGRLRGYGWIAPAEHLPEQIPALGAGERLTYFRDFDLSEKTGCTRSYGVLVDVTAEGKIVRALGYAGGSGFRLCV